MLTTRQLKLIKLLRQDDSYQTVNNLAKRLGCSERTLYSDVKSLKNAGIKILSKRGEGILLASENNLTTDDNTANPILLRRIKIMVELLFLEQTVTLKGLAEKYFVSQTSIKYDFEQIEKILSYGGTQLVLVSDNRGTHIAKMIPSERIRLLFNFNQYIMSHAQEIGNSEEASDIDILESYYPEGTVNVCKSLLYTFIRKNIMTIADVYIESFLNWFIALTSQLIQGIHLEEAENIWDDKGYFYIKSASNLLHKASIRLKFKYTDADIDFLSQMLLNYRLEEIPREKVDDEIIIHLIIEVSKALDINFLDDSSLVEQLRVHIPAMIFRLKYHNSVKNPFTEQIKLEFSITYNVLWFIMQEFGQEMNLVFNEDEIAFLTIYFQLSIEKKTKARRILVVCQTGIVTSELLINRIKTTLPSLDEVEIASIGELDELDLDEYDLILTTVKLNQKSKNIYHISPFIKNEELIKIFSGISTQNTHSTNSSELKNNKDFPVYYPLLNQHFNSKEELFTKVSQKMQKQGLVKKGFAESLLEREKLGSTEFSLGIAIPHGNPRFVIKSFVVFIRTNQKIKWQDHFVDTIFLIGISKGDIRETRNIIQNIYYIISDENRLKKLKTQKSNKEVLKLLYGRE